MRASGFRSMKPSAFSRHSSPRNREAPAWGCPLVGGSSRLLGATIGRAPTQDGVRLFSSRCPPRRQRPQLWPSNAPGTEAGEGLMDTHKSRDAWLCSPRSLLGRADDRIEPVIAALHESAHVQV